MRAIALALVVTLGGCSFLMKDKRLPESHETGKKPDCDTNNVVPTVDLILGITAGLVGIGAVVGDSDGGTRTAMGIVGVIGVAYIAGWWYGRKWHNECEDAKRAYADR